MNTEMRFHLEAHIEELISQGVPPEEARKAALKEFGNLEFHKEECRDAWHTRFLENLVRHLRLAGKQMLRNKGFTLIAAMTLALGIGANTAIYSLANSVLFRPLAFPDSQKIVFIKEWHERFTDFSVSYLNFRDWHDQQSSFTSFALYRGQGYNLIDQGEAHRLRGYSVTHEYFEAFQADPIIGRLFTPEDDQPSAKPTAVIGEQLWRNRFNARETIIGETINLTGELFTVIGVAPGIYPIDSRDVFTPLGLLTGEGQFTNRGSHPGFVVIARLKPDVSLDQARVDMQSIASRLEVEYPDSNTGWGVYMKLLEDQLFSNSKPALFALLAASSFLLLIACVNVANMLLVRAQGRREEFGVRSALGANKSQILGQLTVESLSLGVLGGAIGILLAGISTRWLKEIFGTALPRINEVQIDTSALLYLTIMSVITSFIFGLAPFRQTTQISQREALSSGLRTSESSQGRRWKSALIVTEFALTATLLVGAGLMLRTTAKLYQSDPGLEYDQRIMFSWSLYSSEYNEALKRIQITEQAKQSLKSIPGVGEVGIINPLPLSGSDTFSSYYVEGTPMPKTGEIVTVSRFWANNDFATAVGLKLRAGRFFTEFDTRESQPVAVIDSKFARQVFLDTDPIGRRINIDGGPPSDPNDWKTIIGVVEHVSQYGLTREAHKQIYVPITQESPRFVSFIMETNVEPMTLAKAIRKTMSNIDPNLPIQRLQPYDSLFERTISNERLLMQLLAILSALALTLAAVGLYGVLSYTVRQRTQEIGIRMAIGALPQTVRNLILSSGLRLAGIGLFIGLLASLGLSRFLSKMLYDVSEFDAVSFVMVAFVLGMVGLFACWAPAYRATRIAPSLALRGE